MYVSDMSRLFSMRPQDLHEARIAGSRHWSARIGLQIPYLKLDKHRGICTEASNAQRNYSIDSYSSSIQLMIGNIHTESRRLHWRCPSGAVTITINAVGYKSTFSPWRKVVYACSLIIISITFTWCRGSNRPRARTQPHARTLGVSVLVGGTTELPPLHPALIVSSRPTRKFSLYCGLIVLLFLSLL